MAVPKLYMFYAPIMRALIDGKIHSIDKISIDVAEDMLLSASTLAELLPSKRNTVFDHRVDGALKDLVNKGGFVEIVTPDHYRLTEEGRQLASDPAAIESNNIRVEIALKEMKKAGEKIDEILGKEY